MIPVAINVAIWFLLGIAAVALMAIDTNKRDDNSPTT